MNEQLSFKTVDNEILSEDVKNSLESIIKDVCKKYDYDTKYVEIVENKTGFSVWILEPITLESAHKKIHSDRCFNIKRVHNGKTPRIEVEISYKRKGFVPLPNDCTETIKIEEKTDKATGEKYNTTKYFINFSLDSVSVISYLRDVTEYTMLHYRPKEKFGCCSKYNVCSDNKKCVHTNKFYASRCCWYYNNLENNRIFYGKNKNA